MFRTQQPNGQGKVNIFFVLPVPAHARNPIFLRNRNWKFYFFKLKKCTQYTHSLFVCVCVCVCVYWPFLLVRTVRPPQRQIHGRLLVVPWRRRTQRRQCGYRINEEQARHSVRRLVSHWLQGIIYSTFPYKPILLFIKLICIGYTQRMCI